MKRVLVYLFLIVLASAFASASYTCSNDTEMIEDTGEIQLGERESINSVGISVVSSDEASVISRITADLFIDSKKLSFSGTSVNTTEYKEIDLLSGDYKVYLTDLTETNAKIKITDSSETIEEGEIGTISSLKVFLINADKTDESINADILVGKEQISLSNDDVQQKVVEINSVDYLIELVSASDTGALVSVSKCSSNGQITEIEDEEPEEDENNQTEEDNQTEVDDEPQEDTHQVNISDFNNQLNDNNSDSPDSDANANTNAEPGIMKRIWDWLKNIFT